MNRYESYQDSGIQWLGEVPAHWKVLSIKRLGQVKRGASPRPIDNPDYFDDNGEYAWVRIADVTASNMYLFETTQRLSDFGKSFSIPLEPNSLFLSIAGSVGKPIITKIKACIHDGFVYFPEYKNNTKFLYYIFLSGQPYLGLGKMGTQLNLNTDTVGAIKIGLPPLPEQTTIADYLDNKLGEIDTLISKQETLLAKLAEQRTAMITHAVTKGLNAHAPMKNSGVAWLGDVPEHWDKIPLKFICDVRDGTHDTPQYIYESEKSYPLVTSKDINFGRIDFLEVKFISEEDYLKISKRSNVNQGDLIMPMIGTVGGCAIVETNRRFAIKNVALFKAGHFNTKWLKYFLDSEISKIQFELQKNGGVQDFVGLGTLRNLIVFKIPLPEQTAIADYLDEQTANIDRLSNTVHQTIASLKEYRSALITQAVTGKIKVI